MELDERLFLTYPLLARSADAKLPEVRGSLILDLLKPSQVDSITARFCIKVIYRLGDAQEQNTRLWEQDAVCLDRPESLSAGEHRYPFVFTLQNHLPTLVGINVKACTFLLSNLLDATVTRPGKPDLVAKIPPGQSWILADAWLPDEPADALEEFDSHTEPGVGTFEVTYRTPAPIIGHIVELSLTIKSGPHAVRILSISFDIEQHFTWQTPGTDEKLDPIVERHHITDMADLCASHKSIPPNSTVSSRKIARFPTHKDLTAAVHPFTISPLRVTHDIILTVMVATQGLPRQFSIRREVNLAACGLTTQALDLPSYEDVLRLAPSKMHGANSVDKNMKWYLGLDYCGRTTDDLQPMLDAMSRSEDGESLARFTKARDDAA